MTHVMFMAGRRDGYLVYHTRYYKTDQILLVYLALVPGTIYQVDVM